MQNRQDRFTVTAYFCGLEDRKNGFETENVNLTQPTDDRGNKTLRDTNSCAILFWMMSAAIISGCGGIFIPSTTSGKRGNDYGKGQL